MKEWSPTGTPRRVKRICSSIGRSQAQLARLLGVSAVTVSRWTNGRNQPDPRSKNVLEKLEDKYVNDKEDTND